MVLVPSAGPAILPLIPTADACRKNAAEFFNRAIETTGWGRIGFKVGPQCSRFAGFTGSLLSTADLDESGFYAKVICPKDGFPEDVDDPGGGVLDGAGWTPDPEPAPALAELLPAGRT